MDNRNVITKSNHLIEAGYKLSLNEQRLVSSSIAKIDSRKELPPSIRVTAKDFAKEYKLSENKAYEHLAEAADKLYERDIKLYDGKYNDRIRWLSRRRYAAGEGYVEISFSPFIAEYITNIRGLFTSYKANLIRNLKSTYSIRIFEFLIRWKDTKFFIIKLSDFKEKLELEGKYSRFTNLKSRVIDPSLKELKAHCNLNVTYEVIKKGRTIDSIKFNFDFDKQQSLELN